MKVKFLFLILSILVIFLSVLSANNLIAALFVIIVLLMIMFLFFNLRTLVFFIFLSIPLLNQFLITFTNLSASLFYIGITSGLLLFCFIADMKQNKKLLITIDSSLIFIVLFFLYFVFSIIFISSNKSYGIEKLIFLVISFIYFVLPSLLIRKQDDLKTVTSALFFIGLVYLVGSVFQYNGFIENRKLITFGDRFVLLSLNPIFLARDISYSLIAVLFLIYFYSNDIITHLGKIIFLLIIAFSLSFFMALTGSRGPIVALFTSCIIAAFIYFSSKKNGKTLITMFVIILLITIMLGYTLLPETISNRLAFEGVQGKRTSVTRMLAIIHGFENFLGAPILGIGFGSYMFESPFFEDLTYPHNIIVEILAETGLVGFSLFMLFMLFAIKKLLILNKSLQKRYLVFVLILFCSSFINANFSGHIGYNTMFWFSSGLIFSLSKMQYEK
jgi:O-antigen ligase